MEFCSLESSNINKKRVEGLIQRVCLPLEYSDPGRILSLLRSLFENSADIIQMKINKYLAEVTNSVAAFMIMSFLRKDEYKVTALGEKILPLDLYLRADSEMIKTLLSNEKDVIEIPKEVIDERIKEAIEKHMVQSHEHGSIVELTGFLAVPIRHPISEKTLIHVVLVNTKRTVDYKRISSALINECLRYCLGMVVNVVCYEDEKKGHERARNFIEILRLTLLNIEQTSDMIGEIKVGICDLMNAERCILFLRDGCGNLISKILNYGEQTELAEEPMKNIKLPDNYSLAGIVSRTGDIIICEDARNDPRYCSDLDNKYGFNTRNVLCFPLRQGEEVNGIVEVYNKVPTKDCQGFTEADRKMAESLSVLLTPLIYHSLNFKKIKEHCDRKTLTDSIYVHKTKPTDEDVDEVLSCMVAHQYHEQLHLNFSQLDLPDTHLGCLIHDYFNSLGLIKKYEMDSKVLVRFILSILKDHPQFPFHNWRHSFGTFHFAAVLVNELNLVSEGILTHIEVLGLLIAALCHVADYRGAVSIFQVSCGTTLGALYSFPAHVNQQFQSTQIFRLLHNSETNILENIPAEQYNVFAYLLKKLVSVADIGYYMERFNSMEQSLRNTFQKDDLEQRLHLLTLLMGCSVLSDYSKDFYHCRKIAEMTFAEFLPDVDRSAAEGVFDLSQFTSSVELIPHLQIQIISTICEPSFKILSELFPAMYPSFERCQQNLSTWEKYKNKFQLMQELEHQAELILQAEPEPE